MAFKTTITRIINGIPTIVGLKDATKPIPMSDAERLSRYRGERIEAQEDKIENPVVPVEKAKQ